MAESQSVDAASVQQQECTPYLGEITLRTTNGAHQNSLAAILRQSTQGGLCPAVLHIPSAIAQSIRREARVSVGWTETMPALKCLLTLQWGDGLFLLRRFNDNAPL